MRITDTCPCGAAVTVMPDPYEMTTVIKRHDKWLDAHAVCRKRGPIPLQPEAEPSEHPGDAGQLDTMVECPEGQRWEPLP